MRKRINTVIACCFFSSWAQAQFHEVINTSRPGNAIGAYTVGQGRVQVQSGVDSFGSDNQGSDTHIKGLLTNTVLRFGLTEFFEIGTLIEYKTESITESNIQTSRQGLSSLEVGIRYHIYLGKGLRPSVGFQFRTRLPVLSQAYTIKDLAPRFIFVTSQQLSSKFTLITNWGAAWNGNDSSPQGTYVINLSYAFTDRFGTFIESYGGVNQGTFMSNFDTGFAWLANKNLQFDISGGFGENHGERSHFISVGVSWRSAERETIGRP